MRTLSALMLVAGAGLLAASGLAAARQAPAGGTFTMSYAVDIDYVDPALAYYAPSWVLEYATGAMLLNYPDAPAPRGSRLVPEVASGFPTVSKDGKTYTFRLKRTYRFSNGRRVTAASFAWALNRGLQRRLAAPAQQFLEDVVGARDVANGRTALARGVLVPDRYTLKIKLTRRASDFLARLAMPFFMAIPPLLPANPDGISAPVVSAGPYFIREWTRNHRIVVERNRYYRGPRPHNVRRIIVDIGLPLETIKLNIDSGARDTGDIPTSAHAELGRLHGVRRRSPGRYFANPTGSIRYLALNHDRPLFRGPTRLGNVRLKQAINFAIDRRAMLAQYGAFAGSVHDQLLPPTMRGFRDVALYPGRPNIERARALASGNLRQANAVLYCSNRTPAPAVCQLIQSDLRRIGLEVDIKLEPRVGFVDYRRRGEPFDLLLWAWRMDFFDPYDFVFLVDGSTIRPARNTNLSYFDHPGFNRRIARANAMTGAARYRAFSRLDVELMRQAAPVAVYGVPNERRYVSERTGCYHHQPVYSLDLPAICLRR
jgi:ABC-type oligopeptide transport system substrate-binding subunit